MAKKTFTGALDILGQVSPYQERGEGEMLIVPELDQLVPDPNQPRHIVPDDLRERLLQGEMSPGDVILEMWQRCLDQHRYQAMRSFEISPAEALAAQRDAGVRDWGIQLTLEGLVELADSITRHGLRQPVNVYDLGDRRYRIAEGERRWWAHVHLWTVHSRVEAQTILARVQPLPEDELTALARQQAENVHRADLSAMARARAIQRVREAMTQEVSGTAPRVSGTSGSRNLGGRPRHLDVTTVSQLDDLTGQRLAELTGKGMSGRMVRNYLALLTLPPDAQALAEAAGLTERALRPIVSLDDPAEQVRLVQALASEEMTPAQVAAEVKRLKQKGRREKSDAARILTRFRSSLRFAAGDLPDPTTLVAEAAHWSSKKRSETLDWARRYAAFLRAFLEAGEGLFEENDP